MRPYRSTRRRVCARGPGPAAMVAGLSLAAITPIAHAQTWQTLAPLFAERCVMCHAGETAPLGLKLDSLDGLLAGSANGPVVASGDPAGSELVRRLRGDSLPRMPLTGPPYLPEEDIASVERWIEAGLPAGAAPAAPPATATTVPPPDAPVTYADVAPILAARCVKCHADGGLMGAPPEGFRMTSYEHTLAVDDRARVVPGQPLASELLRRVRGQALPRMPFDGPPWLSDDEVSLIERWIADGARNTAGEPATIVSGARVRLHGTLGDNRTLDGLPLGVDGGTRLDKRPRPGDHVEVRGRLNASGAVRAERIRPRDR